MVLIGDGDEIPTREALRALTACEPFAEVRRELASGKPCSKLMLQSQV